jgi:hypothetical protein
LSACSFLASTTFASAAVTLGRLRRDAGATDHNARERDTGERRDAGAGMTWSRSL